MSSHVYTTVVPIKRPPARFPVQRLSGTRLVVHLKFVVPQGGQTSGEAQEARLVNEDCPLRKARYGRWIKRLRLTGPGSQSSLI